MTLQAEATVPASAVSAARLPAWLTIATVLLCASPLFFNLTGIPLTLGRTVASDSAWHTAVEMIGVMFGLLAAALSVVYFSIRKNTSILVIGLGSGWASCFDLYHMLIYSDFVSVGAVDLQFRSSTAILSRIFVPVLLLSAARVSKLVSKANGTASFVRTITLISGLYAVVGFVILEICFSASVTTQLFFPNNLVSRPFDGIFALVLHAFALRAVLAQHRAERSIFSATLVLVQFPLVMAIMALTFKGIVFKENYFVFAHLFKIYAYALPFAAICLEFARTYRNAELLAAEKYATAENLLAERELALEEQIAMRESAEEAVAEQNARMIHSSKLAALGEVAGGIAHEINTPLAVIQLNAQQLIESLDDGESDPALLREKLSHIDMTTERIARIVRSLRTVSRNGNTDPIECVPAVGIFQSVRDLCEEKLRNNSVRLTMTASPGISVSCRPTELAQVIMNLVQNSCDAVSKLSERWIVVSAEDLGTEIRLSVVDSGGGIAPEIRDRILQPFFTTKEVGKGTGLGLSISKSIMESYGGTLALDPRHAHTRFVLTIPKVAAGASAALRAA